MPNPLMLVGAFVFFILLDDRVVLALKYLLKDWRNKLTNSGCC